MPHKQAKPFVGGYNPGLIARPKTNRSLPEKITCNTCQKAKTHDSYSGNQIEHLLAQARRTPALFTAGKYDIRCKKCIPNSNTGMTCVDCRKTMPLDNFSKAQRRTPDDAVCLRCMDVTLAFEPIEVNDGPDGAWDKAVNSEEKTGGAKAFDHKAVWEKEDDDSSGGIALPVESSNASVITTTTYPHSIGQQSINKGSHPVDLNAVSAALSELSMYDTGTISSYTGTEVSFSNISLPSGHEAFTGANELNEVYTGSDEEDDEDDNVSVDTERGGPTSVPALTRMTTRVEDTKTVSSAGSATNVGGVEIFLPDHKKEENTMQYIPLRIDPNVKPMKKTEVQKTWAGITAAPRSTRV